MVLYSIKKYNIVALLYDRRVRISEMRVSIRRDFLARCIRAFESQARRILPREKVGLELILHNRRHVRGGNRYYEPFLPPAVTFTAK